MTTLSYRHYFLTGRWYNSGIYTKDKQDRFNFLVDLLEADRIPLMDAIILIPKAFLSFGDPDYRDADRKDLREFEENFP